LAAVRTAALQVGSLDPLYEKLKTSVSVSRYECRCFFPSLAAFGLPEMPMAASAQIAELA